MEVIRVLCRRIRNTTHLIEDTAFFELRPRLAKKLLAFAEHFGEADDDGALRISLALSQSELGAMTNAGRESVNRQLRIWVKNGLIAIDQGKISVLDPEGLEQEAEKDE